MSLAEFEKAVSDYESKNPYIAIAAPNGKELVFYTPNRVALWRTQTLSTKEPYTIHWLDNMRQGAVFLDVGANVGMYTIYATVVRNTRTYAFEPESQNYALLNKNIVVNGLSNRVLAVCAALSDKTSLDRLYLSELAIGSSCHSFGEEVGFDLKQRKSPYAQGCLSLTIDSLIDNGQIEVPTYIKVDVDGFEHKVLQGAERTLARPEVEELLIEINPHLAEHRQLLQWLDERGFVYDTVQAAEAARKEGTFYGVGEYIFRRRSSQPIRLEHVEQPIQADADDLDSNGKHVNAMRHVLRRINDTPISTDPFPYAVVDNVFPEAYYRDIQENFPSKDAMIPLDETGRVDKGRYHERLCVLFESGAFARLPESQRRFWTALVQLLYRPDFINGVAAKFRTHIEHRLIMLRDRENTVRVRGDGLIVSDRTNYSIGPHTDGISRMLTFLFYIPQDDSLGAYGTSVYRPIDPSFVSAGGQHYPFEKFTRVSTIKFLPNRLFVFAKNERSFHGVEPIHQADLDRRLLIYNVRLVGA